MMIGLFVVGGAIMQTGLAKLTGNKLMALSRGNETITFLLVMLVTSFIGAFVSNTGTVALMMPIIMSIAAGSGMQSSRFLMPLAFAGSLGGMLTLIGTPPNLVIDEVLTEAGYQPLAFFSFFPVGIIVIAIGIIVLMPLSKIFLSKSQGSRKKKTPSRSTTWWMNTGCSTICIDSSCPAAAPLPPGMRTATGWTSWERP